MRHHYTPLEGDDGDVRWAIWARKYRFRALQRTEASLNAQLGRIGPVQAGTGLFNALKKCVETQSVTSGQVGRKNSALTQAFPTPRAAVAYIINTFPIVTRKDEAKFNGDYQTKRAILEIYDIMLESFRTGRPYQTRLDPLPANPRCCHPKVKVGILAFGSLIGDPGPELAPKIIMRIKTPTPFPVEYGRCSGTRGGAPTLVPHEAGTPVSGEILVLADAVTVAEARDMLWRRERRREGTGETYGQALGRC